VGSGGGGVTKFDVARIACVGPVWARQHRTLTEFHRGARGLGRGRAGRGIGTKYCTVYINSHNLRGWIG
jgi:hypothetical protein